MKKLVALFCLLALVAHTAQARLQWNPSSGHILSTFRAEPGFAPDDPARKLKMMQRQDASLALSANPSTLEDLSSAQSLQ